MLAGGHNVGGALDPRVDEAGVILKRRHILPQRGVLLQTVIKIVVVVAVVIVVVIVVVVVVSPKSHDTMAGALSDWHANALLQTTLAMTLVLTLGAAVVVDALGVAVVVVVAVLVVVTVTVVMSDGRVTMVIHGLALDAHVVSRVRLTQ